MSVITLKVPNRAQMSYGLGIAFKYGVEVEVLPDLHIELTSGDEIRLDKLIQAFQGEVVSDQSRQFVRVDLPNHEAATRTVGTTGAGRSKRTLR